MCGCTLTGLRWSVTALGRYRRWPARVYPPKAWLQARYQPGITRFIRFCSRLQLYLFTRNFFANIYFSFTRITLNRSHFDLLFVFHGI